METDTQDIIRETLMSDQGEEKAEGKKNLLLLMQVWELWQVMGKGSKIMQEASQTEMERQEYFI